MEMEDYFKTLWYDSKSSDYPNFTDARTTKTLCHIINGIRMGKCTEDDFRSYVDANFDNEDFAEDVKKFVSHVLLYLSINNQL